MQLETSFFKRKLGRSSSLTMLNIVQIRLADFDLQSCFQKICVTNHCAMHCAALIQDLIRKTIKVVGQLA